MARSQNPPLRGSFILIDTPSIRAIDVGREKVTEHGYDQLFLISHDVAFTEVTDQIISL